MSWFLLRSLSLAVDGHLLTKSACGLPSVCARGRVLISSSYKDTSHIRSELTGMTPFYLNYVFKDSIFKYNNSLRYQALKLQQMNFQFSSVAQLCPTLCDPMNRSTLGLPVHYQVPEFTQIHVYQVRDAIQPSHPLSSPFPPAFNPSHHQSLFQ